jgi:AraC-like DNA-binding protein
MPEPAENFPANAETAIRRRWLDQLVVESQRVAGTSPLLFREELEPFLIEFASTLPRPMSHVESIVMRSLLIDVAYRCGSTIHDRMHRRRLESCSFNPTQTINLFWRTSPADALGTFVLWTRSFFTEIDRAHPPSTSYRVSRLLASEFTRPWTASLLAKTFATTPTSLRRDFKQEFGTSLHEYQKLARITAALDELPDQKIEAIALSVGYRSRKNFYRAFQDVTGLTPAQFRTLSPAHAAQLRDGIRHRLTL